MLATKVRCCFLTLPWTVVEHVFSCQACVALVQHASDAVVDKATISMEHLCGHGQGQIVSYSSTEDASSIIVRVLQPEKPDLDTIVGRIRLMRTTMRREAHLECDAIARTFDAGLEKLFTGYELFVGTNSSSFCNRFCTSSTEVQCACRYDWTVRSRRSLQRCRMSSLGRSRNARRFTNLLKVVLNFRCHQLICYFVQVRQFAMDLQGQVFERLASACDPHVCSMRRRRVCVATQELWC